MKYAKCTKFTFWKCVRYMFWCHVLPHITFFLILKSQIFYICTKYTTILLEIEKICWYTIKHTPGNHKYMWNNWSKNNYFLKILSRNFNFFPIVRWYDGKSPLLLSARWRWQALRRFLGILYGWWGCYLRYSWHDTVFLIQALNVRTAI